MASLLSFIHKHHHHKRNIWLLNNKSNYIAEHAYRSRQFLPDSYNEQGYDTSCPFQVFLLGRPSETYHRNEKTSHLASPIAKIQL